MSVDFEFRNIKEPWTYKGTPSYNQVKNYFKKRKVKILTKDEFRYFNIHCGKDCWIHIHNVKDHPLITIPHFDLKDKAILLLQEAAQHFKVRLLNDLDSETSDIWSGKSPSKKFKSTFNINLPIVNITGLKNINQRY